ncbi:MAG: D-alanyl-D-alanine carboxypeptidase/D-alanyl-D-alanine-endopeptidase [Gemmatimonadota bacterium]
MKHVIRRTLTIVLAMILASRAAAQQTRPAGDLGTRISAIINDGALARAHWGIEVRDIASGASLYQHNAQQLFIPASNQKLIVAATAAWHLPHDFRYRTAVKATGAVRNGTLEGDLIVRGSGDPTISARYESSRTTVFDRWADSLRARGITRINGGIVVDQTLFDATKVRPDWQAYDLNWWYAGPVAPLGFNDNAIDFRVAPGAEGAPAAITWEPKSEFVVLLNRTRTGAKGSPYTLDFDRIPGSDTVFAYGQLPVDAAVRNESFAVRDPGYYAGFVFREALERKGISVGTRAVRVIVAPEPTPTGSPLFEYASPPLPRIIGPILQTSQNWFAEMLLKTVAAQISGEGSWTAGLELKRKFLVDIAKIDSTEFRLRDASGLSTGNLVTPHALAQLIRLIANEPKLRPALDALPSSGAETGSLRTRLTDLKGRVRAKTGSVSNVDALTGIVETASGRRLAVSIIVNNTGQSSTRARTAIDEIVRVIARL